MKTIEAGVEDIGVEEIQATGDLIETTGGI